MRGNPLLRFVILTLALCGMGVLVFALTAQPEKSPESTETRAPAPESAQSPDESLRIQFESPITPDWVSITHAGTEVLRVSGEDFKTPQTLVMPVSAEGVELVVQASWSGDDTRTQALRIGIERPSAPAIDVTLWGESPVADVLEIPGSSTP